MSKEQAIKLDNSMAWLVRLSALTMISICTYFMQDLWGDWKAHKNEDKATELIVSRHEENLKEHSRELQMLNCKVFVSSGAVANPNN